MGSQKVKQGRRMNDAFCPSCLGFGVGGRSRSKFLASTWTSKRAQNNGPISQNRECRQYRAHYFGHFGGPGTTQRVQEPN